MNLQPEKFDKKEPILDVAEKLFSELGYEGASTRVIAKEANVNMAMLNYYFGSKDGLYKAVLERRLGSFRQTLIDLNEANISSWEKLHRCIDLYIDRVMDNNCFHRLMHHQLSLHQRSDISEYVIESLLKNVHEVKRTIQEGIDNGTFRKVDVEFTVASIFGTKFYLVNSSQIASKLIGKDLEDPKVLEEEIKPRLKSHLNDLLTAHLTKHD